MTANLDARCNMIKKALYAITYQQNTAKCTNVFDTTK